MAIAQQPNAYPDKPKKNRFAHTQNANVGMGDFYGVGIRNKVGKMRDGIGINPISKKQRSTPPKSVA